MSGISVQPPPQKEPHSPSHAVANELCGTKPEGAETTTCVDPENESVENVAPNDGMKKPSAGIIVAASSMVFMNSVLNGMLTVGLPSIARDTRLPDNLILWPASVFGLTCGCTLLLSGSIGDLIGSRRVYLTGGLLLSAFTLGCGLARTGIQLIMFRAISGIAISMCLPTAVSIITSSFPKGKRRNVAFACLGAAQPVGFSIGLTLGGVLVDTLGWRYGFYIVSGAIAPFLLLAFWGIPKDPRKTAPITRQRLASEIDWVGNVCISASLGMFSYSFAVMSGDIKSLIRPGNLVVLILAVLFLAAFIYWVTRQESLNRIALIPPSLFRSTPDSPNRARNFSAICISVFFTWAIFNANQYFTTLYFQKIQHLSTLETSARFVPMIVSGAIANIMTGLIVGRVRADILCVGTAAISAIAPLLLAVADPSWSYWAAAFVATTAIPISADTLFTISNLVITSIFPPKTHGLAGGVFNTISQIGMSVGLAVTAVISSSVAEHERRQVAGGGDNDGLGKNDQYALLQAYKATYWALFGGSVVVVVLSWWGLQRIGKVGLKDRVRPADC
ncbi:integral membrane protein [Histoplasma capsulatum var. duboisii H88]|uniref:Integral membrane protein n=3 Tax=Ajellomyces capsulatus TaxID=5037 RepID=F0UFN8_AJEC8|nr:integral membrane protein [Histoplasma capsulatum var. duboisii H88]